MATFDIHIGIVKKYVSSNRLFRSFQDQSNVELGIALNSTMKRSFMICDNSSPSKPKNLIRG